MEKQIIQLFNDYPHYAILISLAVSTIIAILGVVPSVFITAANILFFGFWQGMFISFLGEAIGAAVAFFLYRKGLKKFTQKPLERFPKIKRLVDLENREAFLLILSLRLLPFVPSGLVTLAAAIGKVAAITFIVASSLGKIPALFIEAYSVYQVTKFEWQGKVILLVIAAGLLYLVLRRKKSS